MINQGILGALTVLYLGALKAPKSYIEDFSKETEHISENKIIKSYPNESLERRSNLDAQLAMSDDDSIGLRISLKGKGPRVDPIIYRLFLDHGIKVQFTGQMPDSIPQYWPKFWFEFKERSNFLKDVLNNITKKSPVYYQPSIKLVIDAKDAETIYRAMPKNGMVILDL